MSQISMSLIPHCPNHNIPISNSPILLSPKDHCPNPIVLIPKSRIAFCPNIFFYNTIFTENSKAPRVRGAFEFAARRREQVSISKNEIETSFCLQILRGSSLKIRRRLLHEAPFTRGAFKFSDCRPPRKYIIFAENSKAPRVRGAFDYDLSNFV